MMDAATLRLGRDMLVWSRATLVRELSERGMLADAGASAEPEILVDRVEGEWDVRLLPAPTLLEGHATVSRLLGRRADALIAVTRAVLAAKGRITAADLAEQASLHRSLIAPMLRDRAMRRDAVIVPFDELVDFDDIVETRRPGELQHVIDEARDSHGLGDASLTEWPNDVLSIRTTILEGGVIGREDDASLVSRYRQDELRRCEELAHAALAIVRDVNVGLASEADHAFHAFVSVAPPEGRLVTAIDEPFVRDLFGGTIAPFDHVNLEPLTNEGRFFGRVREEDVETWRALVAWFASEPSLTHASFLEIGDGHAKSPLPAGVASHGSVLPRLIVGVTDRGSIVGLIGLVVGT